MLKVLLLLLIFLILLTLLTKCYERFYVDITPNHSNYLEKNNTSSNYYYDNKSYIEPPVPTPPPCPNQDYQYRDSNGNCKWYAVYCNKTESGTNIKKDGDSPPKTVDVWYVPGISSSGP